MAKITFKDLLTKLSNVYSDIYLINNTFILAGPESSSNNRGEYYCVLTPDMTEICNDIFDKSKIYYISDIKKAKVSLNEYCNEIKSNTLDNESIINTVKEYQKKILKITDWKNLILTEEEINKIFEERETIELFKDDKSISNITISKSIFPLISEKNISDLYYHINQNEKINELFLSLDFPLFQLYMIYTYIKMD